MKFARIVYGVAAAYGLLSMLPLYVLLGKVGHDAPPPVTHPEFYYGFVGVALVWQLVYILMAQDPVRYRPIMPVAMVEKCMYTVPVVILYACGKVHPHILRPSLVDPIFGMLFLVAYCRTRDLAGVKDNDHGRV